MNCRISLVTGILAVVCVCGLSQAGGTETDPATLALRLLGTPAVVKPMAKSAAAAAYATSYYNTAYNVSYTCPTGWYIYDTTALTYSNGIELQVKNTGFTQTVYIDLYKMNTSGEANLYGNMLCFVTTEVAYMLSTMMPGVYDIKDTTVGTIHLASIQMKEKDANNLTTQVCVRYTQQVGTYVHSVSYYPASADFTTNQTEYVKNWLNLNFINTAVVAKAVASQAGFGSITASGNLASVTVRDLQEVKLYVVDLEGKKKGDIFNGMMSGTAKFDLSKQMQSVRPSVLLLQTRDGLLAQKLLNK